MNYTYTCQAKLLAEAERSVSERAAFSAQIALRDLLIRLQTHRVSSVLLALFIFSTQEANVAYFEYNTKVTSPVGDKKELRLGFSTCCENNENESI
jgi:hypothetical protein